jgi:toxin FitB
MNVVDSSGWIEYFAKGKNARFFIPPVQDVGNLLVPSICIYEVFKRLVQDIGEDSALQAVGIMSYGRVIELDRKIALEAAQISLERKLAMADSIILATARAYDATLWTQDKHFKDMEGVKYIEQEPRPMREIKEARGFLKGMSSDIDRDQEDRV